MDVFILFNLASWLKLTKKAHCQTNLDCIASESPKLAGRDIGCPAVHLTQHIGTRFVSLFIVLGISAKSDAGGKLAILTCRISGTCRCWQWLTNAYATF